MPEVVDPVTGLFACPSCDCLFVAPESGGGARCPLCKGTSVHRGREWLARRAAQRIEAPAPLAPAAVDATISDPSGPLADV